MTAVELFSNGMEAIRPVLNQELFCSYEGKTINLATELYAALAGVFDGITIVLNPATVSVTPFQGIREPIAIGVYSNGNPLRNIRLKAEFVSVGRFVFHVSHRRIGSCRSLCAQYYF